MQNRQQRKRQPAANGDQKRVLTHHETVGRFWRSIAQQSHYYLLCVLEMEKAGKKLQSSSSSGGKLPSAGEAPRVRSSNKGIPFSSVCTVPFTQNHIM